MSEASPEKPRNFARFPAGKTIGGYVIESVIGDGAHAVVYLARRERPPAPSSPEDAADEAPASDKVALKVIHRHLCGDPQIYQRFHREAAILARLDGEHVVKLFESIEEDGLLTIALEHVEGTSLEARLRAAPLAVSEAVEITLQICAALGAAHAAGIVHRDLKPANVLVTATRRAPASSPDQPAEIRVKVVDFGLARLVHGDKETTSLTEQGMIFGSAEYMAPEQARGDEADARSDLYAAGVMLFEMAVGELPFKGRNALAMMSAHVSEAPPAPRTLRPDGRISPALEAIILRALAKDPADRYPSARAFAEAIASADQAPRVITPARDGARDVDPLGAGDTDLHLAPPSLAMARTVPTMVVTDEARAEIAAQALAATAASVRVDSAAPTQRAPDQLAPDQLAPDQLAPAPAPADPPRPSGAGLPRLTSLASIPDTLLSPVYDPPPRSRWLWAVVAILAAAVGVVIGAIAGAR